MSDDISRTIYNIDNDRRSQGSITIKRCDSEGCVCICCNKRLYDDLKVKVVSVKIENNNAGTEIKFCEACFRSLAQVCNQFIDLFMDNK